MFFLFNGKQADVILFRFHPYTIFEGLRKTAKISVIKAVPRYDFNAVLPECMSGWLQMRFKQGLQLIFEPETYDVQNIPYLDARLLELPSGYSEMAKGNQ